MSIQPNKDSTTSTVTPPNPAEHPEDTSSGLAENKEEEVSEVISVAHDYRLAGIWRISVSAEDRHHRPGRLPHHPLPHPAGQEQESLPLGEAGEGKLQGVFSCPEQL